MEGLGNGPRSAIEIPGTKLVRSYMGEFDSNIPDDYFDVVFSISVVEHVPNSGLENFFLDCYRIIKPGGLMLHAIDLYVFDQPTERGRVVDTYRELIDSQPFEWLSTPTIDGQATFRCSYASNSNITMNAWNRSSPSLVAIRKISQSVSIKMFALKPSGDRQESSQSVLTPAEVSDLRDPVKEKNKQEGTKNVVTSPANRKIGSTGQNFSASSVPSKNHSVEDNSSSSLLAALLGRIVGYYGRWPVLVAIVALAFNVVAFLVEAPLQWIFAACGTVLLLFLIGHAASKADYALAELRQTKMEQEQSVEMLRQRVRQLEMRQQRKIKKQKRGLIRITLA